MSNETSQRLHISTGGVRHRVASDVGLEWARSFEFGIELSGGGWIEDPELAVISLRRHATVLLHNYFPVPREPFVLNVSSQDPETTNRTLALARRAISLSGEVGAQFYALHAGYLVEPRVDQLGRAILPQTLVNRDQAIRDMKERVYDLAEYARSRGVRLLLENHALAPFNYRAFGQNFLLMVDPTEIREFMEHMDGTVGLLLDVGHLNTSAKSLGFDPVSALLSLNQFAEGYHLSDNDGNSDAHGAIEKNSWFLPWLRKDLHYYTVEVHADEAATIVESARVVESALAS